MLLDYLYENIHISCFLETIQFVLVDEIINSNKNETGSIICLEVNQFLLKVGNSFSYRFLINVSLYLANHQLQV